MESTYHPGHLRKALMSGHEIIAIWAAYQILRLDNALVRPYLTDFLESPFPDIQDAGIAKIAEIGAQEYIPTILKIFREADGQIKQSAAFVLAQFPNDFSRSLIQRWFERLSNSDQATRMEYEAAAFAYLQIDRHQNLPKVINTLIQSQSDVVKSSVLFMNLMMFCESAQDIDTLLDQYFVLRDLNSDAGLTSQMIEYFGQIELKDWWADRLSRGHSISAIYRQCYELLDIPDSLTDRQFWMEIEQSYGRYDRLHPGQPEDYQRFIGSLWRWVEYLTQDFENTDRLKWVVQGFRRNDRFFPKTIPKILEMESHFLLSAPLVVLLERSLSKWLSDPARYVENIAKYYHSSLLIKSYREEILKLFFPHPPVWSIDRLAIGSKLSPLSEDSSRHEILWRFYRGELLGYDISWPAIFPNPDYSVHLAEGLCQVYLANFAYYIERQDRVAIDYALQLFQLKPKREVIPLLLKNFEYLSQYHTETFYQTIEYLPDPAFKDLLLNKYQYEEFEIARLIFIICKIFDLTVPEIILKDLEALELDAGENSGVRKPIRLHCGHCNNAFQYTVEAIYVDEGSILRMNRLSSDSVWVPQTFICKKCGSSVPFILDDSQLNEFSLQSRVDRILKITPQNYRNPVGQKIILIDFPRYQAVTYTPDAFEKLVLEFENDPASSANELQELWLKQARLYRAMHHWNDCHRVLEKVKETAANEEELSFLKGQVHFKLSDFAEARKQFDRIVRKYATIEPPAAVSHFLEQARYLLKTMDSSSTKRARFKLIAGKG